MNAVAESPDSVADDNELAGQRQIVEFGHEMLRLMWSKYGGTTTLNELRVLNYGVLCDESGRSIGVTEASRDLNIPKSTVSRALTNMRAKGFVTEEVDLVDRRRRVFRLAPAYRGRTRKDIKAMLQWCRDQGWGPVFDSPMP